MDDVRTTCWHFEHQLHVYCHPESGQQRWGQSRIIMHKIHVHYNLYNALRLHTPPPGQSCIQTSTDLNNLSYCIHTSASINVKVCTPSGQPTNKQRKNKPLQQSNSTINKPITLECNQGEVVGEKDSCRETEIRHEFTQSWIQYVVWWFPGGAGGIGMHFSC